MVKEDQAVAPDGNGREPVDLLVTGRVLTLDRQDTCLADGAVAISGDTIVAVGPVRELAARYEPAELLATDHGLVMPGLINVHTHAAMSCFRGLADDLPLMEWLQEHIFPKEAALTGELVYDAAQLSCLEMIRSGTTSFCDMYLFADDVARAAADSGMRAWVGEVLYDFPSPNYGPLDAGFAYVEEMFASWRGHPLITVTVDPHAVYTCSPELLRRARQLADRHDALYVIHLSETSQEVEGALAQFGCTPVDHLERMGLLDGRVLADHCVVLMPAEIELLAKRRVKVAHCPESNMKLASGVAPIPNLLAAGVTVGLGTDGSASNNDVDLFGEMNTAAKLHKVHSGDPTVMAAATTLAMATRGGAAALGSGKRLGSLEPGKKADLIVLDLDQPHLTPLYSEHSQLVYAARGADVIHSVINGRIVMRNRVCLTMEQGDVLDRMRTHAQRIQGSKT